MQIKDGWPVMGPHAVKTANIGKLTGKRIDDEAAADTAAKISKEWRESRNLVWHHSQEMGVMQLVPKELNNTKDGGVWHAGGVKVYELLFGKEYE